MKTTDNQGTTITGVPTGTYYNIHSGHFLRKFANFDLKHYLRPYLGHFLSKFKMDF